MTSQDFDRDSASRDRALPHEQLSAPVTDADFPLVGIGASAGGLEAFSQLLRSLPNDTGMAFIFVQHLEPDHKSLLSEILARTTSMPIVEVEDGMLIVPNYVYVIPPNHHMTYQLGRFQLQARQRMPGKIYQPIDIFFNSLAIALESQAIAIVLSGNGADGTVGITAIKAAGGITFAQAPQSADFISMPKTVIATGYVDFVLTPAQIATELLAISRHPYIKRPNNTIFDAATDENNAALATILALVRSAMGVDFTHYKQGVLQRRLAAAGNPGPSGKPTGLCAIPQRTSHGS
ncbi:hypothetical protein IQ266_15025 [filamentous cyanobacterium LEGE 11480]|uniref:protein-glutamate methylesterase n=1 Tax=Romeriopsis navalis LEGE 11480 TaxID=2777977 RepID=A0A928VR38_9CYAN|nr:chemotaxis protein CheB [Romeriopsis navalis]MBE9031045.1 hypothetical protein [Romeriopsis navalis LEGE 11480]